MKPSHQHKATTERARDLRSTQSNTEKRFWFLVRNRKLGGWKFRRQVPLGPYIVDFYVDELKAIIELDGDQHGQGLHPTRDALRDKWLENNGYFVKRICNRTLFENERAALEDVLTWLNWLDVQARKK